ncbi:MAG: ATP-binding protein [Acidobacteriota bacterium]
MASSPITDLRELRKLSNEDAAARPSVSIEVDVTFVDPVFNWMFVAAGDERLFVFGIRHGLLDQGQRVLVRGEASPGEVLPIVIADEVSILDEDVPLPHPQRLDDLAALLIGAHDCDWVEIEATLVMAVVKADRTLFVAENRGHRFLISVADRLTSDEVHEWIGKRVMSRGVLGYRMDNQPFHEPNPEIGRVVVHELFVQDLRQLAVMEPGPRNSLPRETDRIATIGTLGERSFRLHGHVTYLDAEGLVLEDETGGLRVTAPALREIALGQVLELHGRKTTEGSVAEVIRPITTATLSRPPPLSIREACQESHHHRRVGLHGRLHHHDDGALELRDGSGRSISLVFAPGLDARGLELELASELEVFGVVTPGATASAEPVLLLASVGDVQVLDRWSPFQLQRVALALAGLLALVGMALLWVRMLRLRVAEKTRHLSDTTAQLRTSYDSVTDGLVAVDAHGRTLAANQAAHQLFGVTLLPGDLAHPLWKAIEACSPQNTTLDQERQRASQEPEHRCELDLVLSHPEARELVVASSPIMDPTRPGSPIGRLWVFRDVTGSRRLQRRLLQVQKMESLGNLAGGVAHDFNNLLTVILGNLSLMRDAPLDPDSDELLESAENAAESASHVVAKLLRFSRRTDLALAPRDVNDLVDSAHRLARHSIGPSMGLELDLAPSLPAVLADRVQLEQVLLNLCVNARDAMPDGGTLTITTRLEAPTSDTDERVVISVRDTGTGIDESLRQSIFEPFFTTKPEGMGTGLGLSVSYGTVQQHGGQLEVESELGRGTEFRIVLPARRDLGLDSRETPRNTSTHHATVLVVDDDAFVRNVATRVLSSRGHRVLTAADGREALELLDAQEVDLVVLDLAMPGLSGQEVLDRIRSGDHAHLPVIPCSAQDLSTELDLLARTEGHVQKPFSAAEFSQIVEDALDQDATSISAS